jgi:hypothetical protein
MKNIEFTHISEISINQYCCVNGCFCRVLGQENGKILVHWLQPDEQDENLIVVDRDFLPQTTCVIGPFNDFTAFVVWYSSQNN